MVAVALLVGNTFFVTNSGNGTIGVYNATTGAAINTSFVTGLNVPVGLTLSSSLCPALTAGAAAPGLPPAAKS